MSPQSRSPNAVRVPAVLVALVALVALAGCGGSSPPPASAPSEPPPDSIPRENTPKVDPPSSVTPMDDEPERLEGELVCRRKLASGGTADLFLTWKGDHATGMLRTIGSSGNVTILRVRAERADGVVVVDGLGPTDLVDHLAIVRRVDGKPHMHLREAGPGGAPCEPTRTK